MPPNRRPRGGLIKSLTNELTMLVKAAPTTMPTARSMALPRIAKVLNSWKMLIVCPRSKYRTSFIRPSPPQWLDDDSSNRRAADRARRIGHFVPERRVAADIGLDDLEHTAQKNQPDDRPDHRLAA